MYLYILNQFSLSHPLIITVRPLRIIILLIKFTIKFQNLRSRAPRIITAWCIYHLKLALMISYMNIKVYIKKETFSREPIRRKVDLTFRTWFEDALRLLIYPRVPLHPGIDH